ncbi:MAG TPA: hypothetical protein PLU50_03205 [Pseudobdellovibrionaceae bacterium]|nr:hypothetical protein [Pseudobdellovibrionaceae bacterium]
MKFSMRLLAFIVFVGLSTILPDQPWASEDVSQRGPSTSADDSSELINVDCASKSSCLATDTLEIKEQSGISITPSQLEFFMLSNTATTNCEATAYRHAIPTPQTLPLRINLAPLVQDWFDSNKDECFPHLRDTSLISIKVVVTDKNNKKFSKTFFLDTSPIWGNPSPPLIITSAKCPPEDKCKIGATLKIEIPRIKAWSLGTKTDPDKLTLKLKGIKMTGLKPKLLNEGNNHYLTVDLKKIENSADNMAAWRDLLSSLLREESSGVAIELADEKGNSFTYKPITFEAIEKTIGRWHSLIKWSILPLLIIFVCAHHNKGAILRDNFPISVDDALKGEIEKNRSFSLARVNMAWWSLILAFCWLWSGLFTNSWEPPSDSALLLAGLGVGSLIISMATPPTRIRDLINELSALNLALATLSNPSTEYDNTIKKINDCKTKIKLSSTSKSFVQDIFSNSNADDYELHRLQIAALSFIYGIYFMYQTFTDGTIPIPSSQVLSLMSISATMYLGRSRT